MHYILRTARCMHAWRSDTEAALRKRVGERHAAELKARGDEKQAEIDGLREALAQESRRKDAEIDRLQQENTALRAAEQERGTANSSGHEQPAAQVELLQELQRRTEADHSKEIETYRQQLETYRTETDLLRARLREMEAAGPHDRSTYIDEMHSKLEQQLKHEIHLMNSSMAALEEKYKSQEKELESLRNNASVDGARDAAHPGGLQEPSLAAQVEELKASLQQSEWERAKQQVAVFADTRPAISVRSLPASTASAPGDLLKKSQAPLCKPCRFLSAGCFACLGP